MKRFVVRFWNILTRPSVHFSLGFLTLGGFLAGIAFWGGFNTAVEATNTEQFCIGCHEMQAIPYQQLQNTIHYSNRSGVRAMCSDCHVPHAWTHKMGRKMEASKEVWGWLFGTINTPEKYEAKHLSMAQREWRRLKANDSLECRNCHQFDSMDFTLQAPRAAAAHSTALTTGGTCIDCHKGIAHELPAGMHSRYVE